MTVMRTHVDGAFSWAMALMLASIPFTPGGVAGAAVACIAATVIGCAFLPDRKAFLRDLFADRWVALLAVFFVVMAFSLVNAGEFAGAAKKALTKKWGEYLLLAVFARYAAMRCGVRRAVIWGSVGLAVCLLDTLVQAATGGDLFRKLPLVYTNVGQLYGLTGPFGHYNGLAGYLMPSIIVAVATACAVKDAKGRGVFVVLGAVAVYAMAFTFSRAGWLSTACAAVYAGVFVFSRFRAWACGATVAALVAVMATPFLRERLLRSFSAGGDADRFKIWEGARLMIVDHPFAGVGVGTFMQQLPKYKEFGVKLYAHNCYLQIAAETGLVALVVFLAVYAYAFVRASRAQSYAAKVASVVLAGLAVILAFDTYLYSVKSAGMFWVIMGFAVGLAARREPAA